MYLAHYILKRLLTLIPVLLGITFIAFGLGRLAPGDPAEEALGRIGVEVPTIEQIEEMRETLGLNEPFLRQYGKWLKKALIGDLGTSYLNNKNISQELVKRIPITLGVSLLALSMTLLFGIGLGIIMAIFRGRWVDKCLRVLCVTLLSIPGFWLAIVMIIIFAEELKWLPTSGNGGFKYMVMPAFVLSSSTIGTTARMTRASLIKELGEHYILTAQSKGLTQRAITLRHAFMNALMPLVTLIGNYFGGILGGSAIVESIFALPGLGSYVLTAITSRDYPIVQGYVLLTGLVYVLVTLGIDLCYMLMNPKIRLEGGKAK